MKCLLASAALAAALLSVPAKAQSVMPLIVQSCSQLQRAPAGQHGEFTIDVNGNLCTSGGGSSGGASGTPTETSVSVGTSSTTILAAAAATTFIKLCVASTAANGVWINWSGAAAVQAAPSEYVPPGQCDAWVKSTGFLPTSQINGIGSATTAVTVIYN